MKYLRSICLATCLISTTLQASNRADDFQQKPKVTAINDQQSPLESLVPYYSNPLDPYYSYVSIPMHRTWQKVQSSEDTLYLLELCGHLIVFDMLWSVLNE